MGLNIIDSLDTAIIMGLENQTKEGIEWISENFKIIPGQNVNVFECTIRVLGGLLGAYHLSGEQILLSKAQLLGDHLLHAYTKSSSPIPEKDLDLYTNQPRNFNLGQTNLAEAATLQLEFRDLSRATGNPSYETASFATSEHIHKDGCEAFEGLCPFSLDIKTGKFLNSVITLGARADSYYEYLIKQWLQTGKTIDWLYEDFSKAMKSIEKYLMKQTDPEGIWIFGEYQYDFIPKMDHLVCFLSGSLVLSYWNKQNEEHLEMAKKLGETCHRMYNNTLGMGPEIIHGSMAGEDKRGIFIKPADAHSLLRPEAIEAWFYLYRATGNKKYQYWGWEAFQSIEKYAKISSGGYSSIKMVTSEKRIRIDKMETFFMAETLKYLYLLFDDDQNLLPLDKWVFNTEAHPLPIYNN